MTVGEQSGGGTNDFDDSSFDHGAWRGQGLWLRQQWASLMAGALTTAGEPNDDGFDNGGGSGFDGGGLDGGWRAALGSG